MFKTVLFIIGLLSAHLRFATAGDFLLGMDYSKTIATGGFSSGFTDAAGSFYFVTNTATSSTISKFAVNGSVVWSHIVRFWVMQVAASPAGDIYAAGYTSNGTVNTGVVDRLDPATLTDHIFTVGVVPSLLAVDSAGRTYLAGTSAGPLDVTEHALLKTRPEGGYSFLIRLQPGGAAIDYATWLPSTLENVSAIAADGSGSAIIAGEDSNDLPHILKLSPDGSSLVYSAASTADAVQGPPGPMTVDTNGDVVVVQGHGERDFLDRYSPLGTLIYSSPTPAGLAFPETVGLALDSAGNAYLAGAAENGGPMKNSVGTCTARTTAFLTVVDRSGSTLQSTWIPGASGLGSALVTLGGDSAVYTAFYDVRTAGVLTRFSPNPNAQTVQLTCVVEPGAYRPAVGPYVDDPLAAAVAPGMIVTLFGNGIGPTRGVQPDRVPFPAELANVQVTFDGNPARLLYVQDQQINAMAPWSLIPGQTTHICIIYNGSRTNCIDSPVAQAAPSVFTVDGRYAAALNQDGTINSASNPAKIGFYVSIWATGLGPISPPQSDGSVISLPLPANEFPVVVNSFPASNHMPVPPPNIEYAGPAPFEAAGVSQINFQIPDYICRVPDGSCLSTLASFLSISPPSGSGRESAQFLVYVSGK